MAELLKPVGATMMPRGASEVRYEGSFRVWCALCWVSLPLWSSLSLPRLLSLPFGMRIFTLGHCVLKTCDIFLFYRSLQLRAFLEYKKRLQTFECVGTVKTMETLETTFSRSHMMRQP